MTALSTPDVGAPSPVTTWRRGLRAIWGLFFLNGVLLSSWAAQIPARKAELGISDGQLGLALVAVTGGSLLVLPALTRGLRRYSARRLGMLGIALGAAALAAVGLTDSLDTLMLSLVLLGVGCGALDVCMNALALEHEARAGRPLLSGLHGAFSLGALLGALTGSALTGLNLGSDVLVGVGAFALAAGAGLAGGLPGGRPDPAAHAQAVRERPLLSRGLAALCALVFCAAVAEGAVMDWSGVYLRDVAAAHPALAPLGFAAFSLAMVAGRLGGDWLTLRFGAQRLGTAAGALAAVGLGVALVVPLAGTVIPALALMGLGVSVLAPLAFSAVGRVAPERTAPALALVTAAFLGGYLAGPALIGALATWSSLREALLAVVALCVLATSLARALRTR